MKDRAKVICHMMTTIDGKIDVEFEPSADYDKVGDEYDRLLLSYGQAYGLGRATCQSDLETDLSKYKGVPATYEDTARRYPEGTIICVAFDRWGKLRWKNNVMDCAGRRMPIVEAVTEKCAPEFLAYLNDLQIPYIVAGRDDLDLELFCKDQVALRRRNVRHRRRLTDQWRVHPPRPRRRDQHRRRSRRRRHARRPDDSRHGRPDGLPAVLPPQGCAETPLRRPADPLEQINGDFPKDEKAFADR